MTTRVFFSTFVAAILVRYNWSVSNCARRSGERFGQAACRFHDSQLAQWWSISRIWLAPAFEHDVGPEGRRRFFALDVVFGLATGAIEFLV